jgi:glycosyltransferase involved in cell wall biosynthesis
MSRSEIEARAKAEASIREELARRGPLRAEVAQLEEGTGPLRRLAAAIAGSRVFSFLAGDRSLPGRRGSESERRAVALRRQRFRLSRRKRVLEQRRRGPTRPSRNSVGRGQQSARRRSADAASFCICIAGRDWALAERGGDAALARSLARALGKHGHRAVVQLSTEAGDPPGDSLDVLLVLRGRPAGEPDPDRLNLIWQISHPEEAEAGELNGYDGVLVASSSHAEQLRKTVAPPIKFLPQFTDPEIFHPAPGSWTSHRLAFVGNWRGEFRRIVWDAIQAGRPPALYGQGWDLLVPEQAVAEHVPHDQLHRLYSSCEVLLCDHWEDMRRHGFASNKIFDALACGTFVIADDNPALAEELPGGVETYATPAELGEKIDRYLADPEARRRIARRGRQLVLADHTVEQRAEQLLAIAAGIAASCERAQLDHLRDLNRWPGAPAEGESAAAAGPKDAGGREA